MFDLEREVAEWSASFAARCGRAELVDELEDHIRTHIGVLVDQDMSPEEAFRSAISRLGTPAALDAEFDKELPLPSRVHRWLARLERPRENGGRSSRARLGRALAGATLLIAGATVLAGLDVAQAGAYLLAVFLPLALILSGTLERQ